MADKQEITSKVRKQFGDHAQNYVTSTVHATGDDLNIILRMAKPQPHHAALDIATGGGHTALKLAPHVKSVVASDITQPMLDAAAAFITTQMDNVTFKLADAEALPFEGATFDIVTCRIAPHHFSDVFKFVLEGTRVLKPGGVLVVQDHDIPADERAAEYVHVFEKLRDPSHVEMYSAEYWRGTFLDAQLQIEDMDTDYVQHANFKAWHERMSCPPDVVERLTVLLKQAPDAVRAWMEPTAVGTDDATFKHRYVIMAGRKPA